MSIIITETLILGMHRYIYIYIHVHTCIVSLIHTFSQCKHAMYVTSLCVLSLTGVQACYSMGHAETLERQWKRELVIFFKTIHIIS